MAKSVRHQPPGHRSNADDIIVKATERHRSIGEPSKQQATKKNPAGVYRRKVNNQADVDSQKDKSSGSNASYQSNFSNNSR